MGTGLDEISVDRETGALHGFLQDPDEANRLEIAADAPSVLSLAELVRRHPGRGPRGGHGPRGVRRDVPVRLMPLLLGQRTLAES
jgi:hypothetical protein